MKKGTLLFALGAFGLLGSAAAISLPLSVYAEDSTPDDTSGSEETTPTEPVKTVEYSFWENQELVHSKVVQNKISSNISTLTANTVATNYQADNAHGFYTDNASYSRLVVEVEAAGTYDYGISTYDATADFPVNIYVNSYANKTSTILDNATWWQKNNLEYSTIPVELNEGRNVIVTQTWKWGNLVTFTLPETVKVVSFGSETEGTYSGTDLIRAEMYVEDPQTNVWDGSKALTYKELRYDASDEYRGATFVNLDLAETTKSLDFEVQVDQWSGELASLELQANGKSTAITFGDGTTTGEPFVAHVPSYALEELGISGEGKYSLRIINTDSAQKVRLNSITESTAVDVVSGKVIAGDKLKSSVKINGRSLDLADGGIALDWSGSGVEFVMEGQGDVIANFSSKGNSSNTRFVVEVDDQDPVYVTPSAASVLASDLPEGTHTFRLTKTSEAAGNLYQLNSLTVDKDATLTPAEERDTKFLFLGASIVCGNQMGEVVGEDYYQAWGNLLTRAYDADAQTISCSGRGLIQGTLSESSWAQDNTKQITDIYTKTSFFRDASTEYDMDSFVPNAIFINAGNNDLSGSLLEKYGTTVEDIAQAAVDLTSELRALYKDASIVWLWGVGTNHGRNYGQVFEEAIAGIADENVAFVNCDETKGDEVVTGTMIQGLSGHPTQYQHDQIAEKLSAAYSDLKGVDDPYTRKYDFTRYEAEDYASGGKINIEADDAAQNWSGGKYVGDLPNNEIEDIADVESKAANIGHIAIPVDVKETGVYEIQIGYATSANATFGISIDDGEFTELTVNSGDWCGGHGVYETYTTTLYKGQRTIYLTAALSNWINYDYVNVLRIGSVEDSVYQAAKAYADHFLQVTGEECETSALDNDFDEAIWTTLASDYEALDPEVKDYIYYSDDFSAMRERYSFIMTKYGFTNFLTNASGTLLKAPAYIENTYAYNTNWGLVAGILALVAVGGAIVAVVALNKSKKRKEQ